MGQRIAQKTVIGNKFGDIVPLTDIKAEPNMVVRRTNGFHRPILLTGRGRGVAVM